MNRKPPKRGGGRRVPPNEHLIGRSEVAQLLQCDIKAVRRYYQKKGLLKPALTEPDGCEWFDREAVGILAAAKKAGKRKSSSQRLRAVRSPPTEPPTQDEYFPELRGRRGPLPPIPRPPVKARAPTREVQRRETGPMPRGIGPRTEIRPEWWDSELTPLDPARDEALPRAPSASGTTEIDPRWFDPDFEPKDD